MFPGTTIRVIWSPPTEGATVTGYRVVYTSSGSPSSSGSRSSTATSIDLTGLINDDRTYTITVEAVAEHFPGVSEDMTVVLSGEFMIQKHLPMLQLSNNNYSHTFRQEIYIKYLL